MLNYLHKIIIRFGSGFLLGESGCALFLDFGLGGQTALLGRFGDHARLGEVDGLAVAEALALEQDFVRVLRLRRTGVIAATESSAEITNCRTAFSPRATRTVSSPAGG